MLGLISILTFLWKTQPTLWKVDRPLNVYIWHLQPINTLRPPNVSKFNSKNSKLQNPICCGDFFFSYGDAAISVKGPLSFKRVHVVITDHQDSRLSKCFQIQPKGILPAGPNMSQLLSIEVIMYKTRQLFDESTVNSTCAHIFTNPASLSLVQTFPIPNPSKLFQFQLQEFFIAGHIMLCLFSIKPLLWRVHSLFEEFTVLKACVRAILNPSRISLIQTFQI